VAPQVTLQPIREPVDAQQFQLHIELQQQLSALGAQWQRYLLQKAAVDAVITKIMAQQYTRLDA
jgi:glutamate/tyrosine decarboxylase-like PLP-dependent enzyme